MSWPKYHKIDMSVEYETLQAKVVNPANLFAGHVTHVFWVLRQYKRL